MQNSKGKSPTTSRKGPLEELEEKIKQATEYRYLLPTRNNDGQIVWRCSSCLFSPLGLLNRWSFDAVDAHMKTTRVDFKIRDDDGKHLPDRLPCKPIKDTDLSPLMVVTSFDIIKDRDPRRAVIKKMDDEHALWIHHLKEQCKKVDEIIAAVVQQHGALNMKIEKMKKMPKMVSWAPDVTIHSIEEAFGSSEIADSLDQLDENKQAAFLKKMDEDLAKGKLEKEASDAEIYHSSWIVLDKNEQAVYSNILMAEQAKEATIDQNPGMVVTSWDIVSQPEQLVYLEMMLEAQAKKMEADAEKTPDKFPGMVVRSSDYHP